MTCARMAILLVALGFCLPGYGEILVYKYTDTGTGIEETAPGGEWQVHKETHRGYIVVQVNYADLTVTQAAKVEYEKDAGGKSFTERPIDIEIVRVEDGSRVRWIILSKGLDIVDEEVKGHFLVTAGNARNRNVGTGENREVASATSGYVLSDTGGDEERQEFGLFKISLTLYPAWTYWANGDDEDEGGQDFDTVVQMIEDYLTDKGYTEEIT